MNQNKQIPQKWLIACVFIFTLAVSAVSFLQYNKGTKTFEKGGRSYTGHNNYLIFEASFYHLLEEKDLYIHYPSEHWDLYKYSPTFALAFAPLAALPDLPGLLLWNLLNCLTLLAGLYLVFRLSRSNLLPALAFVVIELITSTQNSQSNALIAGLILIAFYSLEKKRPGLAVLLVLITAFIKLNGIIALSLFVFYPGKLKAMGMGVVYFVLLAILPIIVIPLDHLVFLYGSWWKLLQADHGASYGISFMGILKSWFNADISKELMLIMGTFFLLLPLIRFGNYMQFGFRKLFLCYLLVYMVIFNHKAESATFIIAITGIAIWFFTQRAGPIAIIFFILACLLTIISPTDIFPRSVRNTYITPYALKALPCVLIWILMAVQLFSYKRGFDRYPPY